MLSKLRPAFSLGGIVTAGNSSQTSDGASFVIVMSERMVKELNLEPIARMVNCASAGVDPSIMGIGPVEAIPMALKAANLKLSDIELIELNEAFAAQGLAVMKSLDMNPDIVNVNGGAIALGHPIGMSGNRLAITLLYELRRRGGGLGAAALCGGGGQGDALVLRVD